MTPDSGRTACTILPVQIDACLTGPKLPLMPSFCFLRRPFAPATAACVTTILLGCTRSEPRATPDSASALSIGGADSASARRNASGWNPAAGPALLVQGATRDDAIVLWPTADDSTTVVQLDSASAHGVPVILLGRGGARVNAQLGSPAGEGTDDCDRWPLRVPAGTAGTWSVGFIGRQVSSMPLDSVDVLSPRDSMMLVAEASRLASSVTAPTSASFQGLRFTAHDIRRFHPVPGVDALVAHLVRRVNQEANPQEEQTLLIAERDSGATSGPYRLVYAERAFGREEAVATPEVLAGLHLGSPSATLLVARDSDDGVTYSFLERIGPRQWRKGWVSALTRCG
jgi:hypothetical protein